MCYKICMIILAIIGLADILPVTIGENIEKYDTTSSGCEYPFQIVNNECYLFSDVQLDFNQAISYCESLTHGHTHEITLAMLDYGRDEDQALLRAVATKNMTFWVGGKFENDAQWMWLDGRDISLDAPFWEIHEPNELQNKCMAAESITFLDKPPKSYLYDHNCSDSVNFICQTGKLKCPMDFIRIGNYCYLQSWTFGVPDLSWKEARDYCQSLSVLDDHHADLAVLGLQDQNDYYLINNLLASYVNHQSWIGAHRDSECYYQWIDGRELPLDSIYWYYNQPDCGVETKVGIYHYSNVNRTVLHDYSATDSFTFICQMFRNA